MILHCLCVKSLLNIKLVVDVSTHLLKTGHSVIQPTVVDIIWGGNTTANGSFQTRFCSVTPPSELLSGPSLVLLLSVWEDMEAETW